MGKLRDLRELPQLSQPDLSPNGLKSVPGEKKPRAFARGLGLSELV
jgi:hypothetical protein